MAERILCGDLKNKMARYQTGPPLEQAVADFITTSNIRRKSLATKLP
jgi:hypothetical protein